MEPTIQQVFGATASLTSTQLIISLEDLEANGLDISTTPTAEALLVALLLEPRKTLNEENFGTNADQSIYFRDGFGTETVRGEENVAHKIDVIEISLSRPKTLNILDPNAY
ncbi:hypothetical protein BDGGKGIB_03821 [Nodularia sphaerocarpa UHCC 0038]|nr:hypothetical protein BDGGKGIB_03821 [Nodularia sphaerocarpa UHCC 0038]